MRENFEKAKEGEVDRPEDSVRFKVNFKLESLSVILSRKNTVGDMEGLKMTMIGFTIQVELMKEMKRI